MHGPFSWGSLSAIPLFVVFSALSHAQLSSAYSGHQGAGFVETSTRVSSAVPVGAKPLALSFEQRGDILSARRQYQAAIAAYAKITQPSAAVWNKMGIAYQMLYDPSDAARCYNQSLALDRNEIRALNNLATVDDSISEFPAAERLYKQALRLEPQSAQLFRNLGTNLLMQHQYRRGMEAYTQALAIDARIFNQDFGPSVDAPTPASERGAVTYFEARSCARAGLTDCALSQLRKAFNEGSATIKSVSSENDFARLRGTPEFQQLLAEQQ
jgi:tetratricopeptide (TPR) repeat protein